MRQQVNLYQEELFVKKRQPLCFAHLAMIWGIAVLLVIASFGQSYLENKKAFKYQETVKQQLNEIKTQFAAIEAQFPERTSIAKMKEELGLMEQNLGFKIQLMQTLSDKTESNLQGFSRFLEGLARQVITELWLSEIHIAQGGNELLLKGKTYKPERVFHYMTQLTEDKIFASTEFKTFFLNRAETPKSSTQSATGTDGAIIEFALSTVAGADVSLSEGKE